MRHRNRVWSAFREAIGRKFEPHGNAFANGSRKLKDFHQSNGSRLAFISESQFAGFSEETVRL